MNFDDFIKLFTTIIATVTAAAAMA